MNDPWKYTENSLLFFYNHKYLFVLLIRAYLYAYADFVITTLIYRITTGGTDSSNLMRPGIILTWNMTAVDFFFFSEAVSKCSSHVCLWWMTSYWRGWLSYDTLCPLSRPLPVAVDKQGLDFSACQAFFSPCLSWSFERPLSFPPRITEHKDTQSCGVIQFVLSSLPHRLFA